MSLSLLHVREIRQRVALVVPQAVLAGQGDAGLEPVHRLLVPAELCVREADVRALDGHAHRESDVFKNVRGRLEIGYGPVVVAAAGAGESLVVQSRSFAVE